MKKIILCFSALILVCCTKTNSIKREIIDKDVKASYYKRFSFFNMTTSNPCTSKDFPNYVIQKNKNEINLVININENNSISDSLIEFESSKTYYKIDSFVSEEGPTIRLRFYSKDTIETFTFVKSNRFDPIRVFITECSVMLNESTGLITNTSYYFGEQHEIKNNVGIEEISKYRVLSKKLIPQVIWNYEYKFENSYTKLKRVHMMGDDILLAEEFCMPLDKEDFFLTDYIYFDKIKCE